MTLVKSTKRRERVSHERSHILGDLTIADTNGSPISSGN